MLGGGGGGGGEGFKEMTAKKIVSHFQYFIYCLFGIIELRGGLKGVANFI